jgi:hypothetical protein
MKNLKFLLMVAGIAIITACGKSSTKEDNKKTNELEIYANTIDCDTHLFGYDRVFIRKDYKDATPMIISENRQKTRSRIDVYMDSITNCNMNIGGYDTVILHKPVSGKYKISMDPK